MTATTIREKIHNVRETLRSIRSGIDIAAYISAVEAGYAHATGQPLMMGGVEYVISGAPVVGSATYRGVKGALRGAGWGAIGGAAYDVVKERARTKAEHVERSAIHGAEGGALVGGALGAGSGVMRKGIPIAAFYGAGYLAGYLTR